MKYVDSEMLFAWVGQVLLGLAIIVLIETMWLKIVAMGDGASNFL